MNKTIAKYLSNKKVFDLRSLMDLHGIKLRELSEKVDEYPTMGWRGLCESMGSKSLKRGSCLKSSTR